MQLQEMKTLACLKARVFAVHASIVCHSGADSANSAIESLFLTTSQTFVIIQNIIIKSGGRDLAR